MAIKPVLSALLCTLAAQQEVAAFSGVSHSAARVRPPSHSAPIPALVRAASFQPGVPSRVVTRRDIGSLMLYAAEGDDGEAATSDGDEKKLEGRKKRVVIGYKAMTTAYLAVGAASLLRAGGVSISLLRVIAGYVAMPAGLSYILISAATHDRLGSDTYKRLNLAMLEHGLVGLAALKLGGNRMLAPAFVLSVINCAKGYAYGVLGWDKKNDASLPNDLVEGTKGTAEGFFSIPKDVKSFGYLVATATIASLKLLKLSEFVRLVRAQSLLADGAALLLARLNRLALLALGLYTLKDAADRDRLGGTTFIQLNYLCSLAMGVHFAFETGGIATPAGALGAFLAAFCAFNGIASYMKNQYA